MNIETIPPQRSFLKGDVEKWVFPKQAFYSVKKLLTSDFGMWIAGA